VRNRVIAYVNRGLVRQREQPDAAIPDFDAAIRLDPKYAKAYAGRGLVRFGAFDFGGAIDDLNEALRLDPKDIQSLHIRGDSFALSGYSEKAIADYSEIIRLQPDQPSAYFQRAVTLQTAGDAVRAIADLDVLLRLKPDDSFGLSLRCRIRAESDLELQKAVEDCDKALKLRPGADVLENRALANFRLGRFRPARVDYEAALRTEPKMAEAMYGLGIVKRRMGDIAGGNADIAAAIAEKASVAQDFARFGVKP
jgi:tetratricopeptide (TPR) repeat protein